MDTTKQVEKCSDCFEEIETVFLEEGEFCRVCAYNNFGLSYDDFDSLKTIDIRHENR